MALEREHMQRLADVLRARLGRDECGDPVIKGRMDRAAFIENCIHACGPGYAVVASFQTARRWTRAKQQLTRFCELRQDGDLEGVLYLPTLPTRPQAAVLRQLLGIAKVRECRPETIAKLQARTAARRFRASSTDVDHELAGTQRAISAQVVSGCLRR